MEGQGSEGEGRIFRLLLLEQRLMCPTLPEMEELWKRYLSWRNPSLIRASENLMEELVEGSRVGPGDGPVVEYLFCCVDGTELKCKLPILRIQDLVDVMVDSYYRVHNDSWEKMMERKGWKGNEAALQEHQHGALITYVPPVTNYYSGDRPGIWDNARVAQVGQGPLRFVGGALVWDSIRRVVSVRPREIE